MGRTREELWQEANAVHPDDARQAVAHMDALLAEQAEAEPVVDLREPAPSSSSHRCPFVRAVGEGRIDDARAIALAGDDPADEGAIPALLEWAARAWAGEPVFDGDHGGRALPSEA